jgi:hypothetical protein
MRLRLRWWRRRDAAPLGRHVRPEPGTPARADSVTAEPTASTDVDATPTPTASIAAVALVFSDGASVELDADDPRVATFRDAAAAVLEHPHP